MHKVTYLHFGLRGGASITTAMQLAWYMYVFTTDATGALPTNSIFAPSSSSNLVAEKSLMDRGMRGYSATIAAGDGNTWPTQSFTMERVVSARRRMAEDDALVFVVESSFTLATQFDLMWRTYMTW